MKTTNVRFFSWELGLVLLVAGVGMAQPQAGSPSPGPEQQKMAYFAGKWKAEGEMKPSPLGPGGKFTYTQNCDWFDGNFALVCHADGTTQAVSVKSISIMAWDPVAKTYTYFSTNSQGQEAFSRGTADGDTWTWNSESKINGKPVLVRFTVRQSSPDVATYKFEMAPTGEPLQLMMDGTQSRLK